MKAIKSDNPLFARINKNFLIKYREPNERAYKLTTAKKLSIFLGDEELKLRLFDKAMKSGKQVLKIEIRERLTIIFHSK